MFYRLLVIFHPLYNKIIYEIAHKNAKNSEIEASLKKKILLTTKRVFALIYIHMSSREDTPISVDDQELPNDIVSDSSLKALLQEETKLKAQLDALTTEIAKLESQVNPAPKEDDNEGEYPGAKSDPFEANILIGCLTDIDMEEFEAPQWCVPIKANVMNFDWDVSSLFPV